MFRYKYVCNRETGILYWISRAELLNDEGPEADGDGDWYEVNLEPCEEDGQAIYGLDLITYADGTVNITKGLDPNQAHVPTGEPGRFRANTVPARIANGTLFVGGKPKRRRGRRRA